LYQVYNAVMLHPEAERSGLSAHAPRSQRVARNSALYFSSLAIPALAAVFLVPVTVRALGPARFGLLALAWAIAEGTGIFDFGLGKATIRFVADATARGSERIKDIVLVSAFSQTTMGGVVGLLLFMLAPLLAYRVFGVEPAFGAEAVSMFRVLALHLPVLLGTAALRAALEGAQRFDISTSLRLPGSLASVVVPAIAARAGYSLAVILWILLAVRICLFLLTAGAVRRSLFSDRWTLPTGFATLRAMLRYSGWVAISSALGPILASFDRFVLGSIGGVARLGFYTGAAEAANRFLLIPVTAFSAMLPALAATDARDGRGRALYVTHAARRQLATLMLPLCLTLFVFAPTILRVWLGPAYGNAAGSALRILSVGIFLTGLAVLPLALLYGSGRPDLPAKINLVQVVVHIPLTIALIRVWGITGAALAVTIRSAEDFVLYEWAIRNSLGRAEPDAIERTREAFLFWCGLGLAGALVLAARLQQVSWVAAFGVGGVCLVAYGWLGWSKVFSPTERRAWKTLFWPARTASR
jgi:O-antigen/teichoic acid export membrane protein